MSPVDLQDPPELIVEEDQKDNAPKARLVFSTLFLRAPQPTDN